MCVAYRLSLRVVWLFFPQCPSGPRSRVGCLFGTVRASASAMPIASAATAVRAPNPIEFIHIPKTGGQAIEAWGLHHGLAWGGCRLKAGGPSWPAHPGKFGTYTRGCSASTSHRSHGRRRTRRPSPPAPPPSASSATLSRAPSQSIPGKPSGRRTGAPARSMVKVPVLAVPQLGSCAFSGRVWRLRAARDTHGERPGHWAPSYCLRCSSEPPQSRPFYCF